MNIGNQIKALRLRRGVTQEELAQHFGITSQAVSKWECGSSVPDIGMLPGLSAYFGVSIDELFELSDELRMERIQNMLYDVRFMNPADVDSERKFLLEKARREPNNNEVYEMLANLELHIAGEHNERAAEYAQAEFIAEREGGMDAQVQVRGNNLSGGQKQRLLIARALAGRPEILILDDASSALDYRTDAKLRRALREHFRETTTVLVAQRVSSLRHADVILMLHDGGVTGVGDHAHLMATCEEYRIIAQTQMGDAEEGI